MARNPARQVPTAADLAEPPEVTLTTAIRAKALELGNSPVAMCANITWAKDNDEAGYMGTSSDNRDCY